MYPYTGFYVKFPGNDNALDVDASKVNTDFELCANNFLPNCSKLAIMHEIPLCYLDNM